MKAPGGFRGDFRSDDATRAVYSEAAGVARMRPAAVAIPESADDVIVLLRWAAHEGRTLTARGAGTSMANGAVGPGVIVDFARLNAVGTLRASEKRIVVGPAVTRDHVDAVARAAGLCFPVDPSSGALATVGGMCATNAAGSRTVKYGQTRRWVSGMECVFADGSRGWLRRGAPPPAGVAALDRFLADVAPRARALGADALTHPGVRKESSGYGLAPWLASGDAVDLIVGSEGTLACIVAVELMLAPLPGATASLVAGFADLGDAVAAAAALAAADASAVELLDRSFVEIATETGDPLPIAVPAGLEALLIVEVEGDASPDAAAALDHAAALCNGAGASFLSRAVTPAERERLWKLRHAASPILNRLAPRLQSLQLVEDGCVPPAHFAEYVRGVRGALEAVRFRGVIFGHAGDGHAHVNALVDLTERDWRARAERLIGDVTALVARLGGTVSGEHGDGRLRAPLLSQVWSAEALELFAATKRAFDPKGTLNPGVKVAAPGAKALGEMKYETAGGGM